MLRFDKESLLTNPSVRNVYYEGDNYFSIEDVSKVMDADLSKVVATVLPVFGKYIRMATIEDFKNGTR